LNSVEKELPEYIRDNFLGRENVYQNDPRLVCDMWSILKGKAAKFIDKLPEGYQTPLGRWFNKGQELSGGEWQRVALSRAFMRTGADILVLDEPTASMDSQTESEIFDDFQSLTADKIAILISHRFSTVRRAELIMVMDQGEIIERGSHGELLAMGGQYARLFELQARGYR